MTLEQAIDDLMVEQAIDDLMDTSRSIAEVAESESDEANRINAQNFADDCEQLAAWLRELKERRKAPEIVRRPVVGYEGYYEVDNCGRVYAIDRTIHVEDHGRIYDKPLKGGAMKQHVHSRGYKAVCLTRDGKTKTLFVHRIVAMAFLPNPENLPCINHKDEDKTNNFVDNLEWCSYQYNNAYGSKPRKHSKHMTGRKQSDEQRMRRSESLKRYWANKRAEGRADG